MILLAYFYFFLFSAPSIFFIYIILCIWLDDGHGTFGRSSVAPDIRSFILWPYPPITLIDALFTYQVSRKYSSQLTTSRFTM